MVHLFRGRGFARPPILGPRHMRPHSFEPGFVPYGMPRGRPTRPHMRPRPMPPPRMAHPPMPARPHLLPHVGPPPREMPLHHIRPSGIIPPPIPPVGLGLPPMGRPIRLHAPSRGRGMFPKRGMPLKRLVSSNGVKVKKNQKRKEKTEGAFFCETCDRGWKTEEKLQEHVAQHELCGRDGCTFTAHPKVVAKHIQIQHDSGLYNRINIEDAAKWIAERKRRFPTKENVEKKEAQMNEMIKRGERIPNQEKCFQNNQNHENWKERRKRRNEHSDNSSIVCKKMKVNRKQKRIKKPREVSQWKDPDAWRGDLPQFPGTAAFPPPKNSQAKDEKEDGHFSDDDELKASGSMVNSNSQKPIVSNVLAALMLNYGSDMSDEDEDDDLVSSKVVIPSPVCNASEVVKSRENVQDIECISKPTEETVTQGEASDSEPEEAPIEREDKFNIPVLEGKGNKDQVHKEETESVHKDTNEFRYKSRQGIVPMKRHQLSLLEKLLKNEIIHERNVILQCVRYVVQNNFLGCGNLAQAHTVDR